MNHRLVRNYLTVGSHDIAVPTVQDKPRLYRAQCKTCQFASAPDTGSKADKALIAHRDETIAAFVEAQLADLAPARTNVAPATLAAVDANSKLRRK